MEEIQKNEEKHFEELYIALQILILLILVNLSIPLVNDPSFSKLILFSLSVAIYLGTKIFFFIKTTYFFEQNSSFIKNKMFSLIDGIFVGVFIFIQLNRGINVFDFLYIYIVIQSIRYHKLKSILFCIITLLIHITILIIYDRENMFSIELLISLSLYFVISVIIQVALNQLNELKEERSYYYNEVLKKNLELKALVTKDYLTNLDNHQSFYSYYDEMVKYAYFNKKVVGLTLIDIDNFKLINDKYGHLAGDSILKELGFILKSNIRKSDFAARYGGEEFAIIFPDTSLNVSILLAERIRKAVDNYDFEVDGEIIKVTISLGIDTFTPISITPNQYSFIKQVDKLLYEAKHSGKNQVKYNKEKNIGPLLS